MVISVILTNCVWLQRIENDPKHVIVSQLILVSILLFLALIAVFRFV